MTTPNDNTPISIIQDAYANAGLIEAGASVDSEQIVSAMRKLTNLINFEQTQGLKLWLNTDLPITLTAGTGTYTLGPAGTVVMTKPLRGIEAYYLDSTGIRRPLVVLSWDDYIKLSQVNQTGEINSYFINKQQLVLSVFFWLIPDATCATGTAHLLIQEQVTGPINVTETMNFPVEWRLFLEWELANQLSTGQPAAITERCEKFSGGYRSALEDWDVEDAPTRFTPDARMSQHQGRFR